MGLILCLAWPVSAITFDKIQPAPQMLAVEDWSASIQAIKALEQAIEDDEVRQRVREALENVSTGFLPCAHNVYRCDDTRTIVEVIIDDFSGGRVNWASFPSTVRHIQVRNSALQQALVLTELPRQLEDFNAVDTLWEPKSLLVHPFNALHENGVPLMPCGPIGSKECVFQLRTLQCVNCGLREAFLEGAAPLFPRLTTLNLNNNSLMSFDVRSVPPSLSSLQLSHARLGDLNVADVLARVPKALKRLNISFTGVQFEWGMLKAVASSVTTLDLSGLLPSTPVRLHRNSHLSDVAEATALLQETPLESICSPHAGMSPVQLYLSSCGIAGELPNFTLCEQLEVLDMSHNHLTRLRFDKLPKQLQVLHLNNNAFTDVLDVAQLPRGLLSLDLSANRMTGNIRIADLPTRLEYFDVSRNALSGNVNLTQLPDTMKFVYLQHNNFTGEADLVEIPLGLRFIMIHHNNWDYRLPAP
jgi:hypothetical protein